MWVEWQEHTDITLTPITDALLASAGASAGERVVDIGCGCGAVTIDLARAVGASGKIAGLDISGPMLTETERRSDAAGISTIEWIEADAATAALGEYDLLASVFSTMFFGDQVAAFSNMRASSAPGARLAMVSRARTPGWKCRWMRCFRISRRARRERSMHRACLRLPMPPMSSFP